MRAAWRLKAVSYLTQASPSKSWLTWAISRMYAISSGIIGGSCGPSTATYVAKHWSHVCKSATFQDHLRGPSRLLPVSSLPPPPPELWEQLPHLYKLPPPDLAGQPGGNWGQAVANVRPYGRLVERAIRQREQVRQNAGCPP